RAGRPVALGARSRNPDTGRRGQSADHQVLGRLVEHAAPAGLGATPRRPDDPCQPADAAAGLGGRFHPAVLHAAPDGDQDGNLPAAGNRDAPHRGARSGGNGRMTHTLYVSAAYGITALVIAALVGWILLDQAARRRELAD